MKKSLLILFAIIFAISLNTQAEDFSVVHNGDTIYYNILSSNFPLSVEVTFLGTFTNSYNEYTGSIHIPDSVLYNGNYYKVTTIGDGAFFDCNGLTSINIPDSITSIGSYAFYNCVGISTISIPSSVVSIGHEAFFNTTFYNNLPDGLIYINNILYSYKGIMPANTSITLQSGTTSIVEQTFYNCTGLTSINIPNSVTFIGDLVFYGCSGLTSITMSNSLTSIGNYIFNGCSSLTSIIIPNSVISIGELAFKDCTLLNTVFFNAINCTLMGSYNNSVFSGCDSLKTIIIGDSVTTIPNHAFSNCKSLTSIIIPTSVTNIGGSAFNNCSSLKSIVIPNSISEIKGNTFSNCISLEFIDIPSSVNIIYFKAFSNCSSLSSITIPPFITIIGSLAFENCTSLDTVYYNAFNCVNMGNDNNEVFKNCNNLNTIIINDSVKNIPSYAFSECLNLSSITFPLSIINIGDYILKNCNGLLSITNKTDYPPTISPNSFYSINKDIPVYVPCNSIQNYQLDTIWDEFTNYIGYSFTPTNLNLQLIDSSIHFSWAGNSDMYIVYRNGDSITSVINPSYIDTNIQYNETYCYKIKSITGDCESDFSDIVCKSYVGLDDIKKDNITTKLYPNPSDGKAKLDVEGLNTEADVLVYDMIGRVVQKHRLNKGKNHLEIDLSGYAKGVYSVRIVNESVNQTLKLIVQ